MSCIIVYYHSVKETLAFPLFSNIWCAGSRVYPPCLLLGNWSLPRDKGRRESVVNKGLLLETLFFTSLNPGFLSLSPFLPIGWMCTWRTPAHSCRVTLDSGMRLIQHLLQFVLPLAFPLTLGFPGSLTYSFSLLPVICFTFSLKPSHLILHCGSVTWPDCEASSTEWLLPHCSLPIPCSDHLNSGGFSSTHLVPSMEGIGCPIRGERSEGDSRWVKHSTLSFLEFLLTSSCFPMAAASASAWVTDAPTQNQSIPHMPMFMSRCYCLSC